MGYWGVTMQEKDIGDIIHEMQQMQPENKHKSAKGTIRKNIQCESQKKLSIWQKIQTRIYSAMFLWRNISKRRGQQR